MVHNELMIYECSTCPLRRCVGYEKCSTKHILHNKLFNHKYVSQRNALIPKAEKYANDTIGVHLKTDQKKSSWNKCFHDKMNKLAARIKV